MSIKTIKPVLVNNVSDDIRTIHKTDIMKQNTSLTAYAVGNVYKGTPIDSTLYEEDAKYYDSTGVVDMNKITTGCLRRISTTVLNGPAIADTTGYIQVITHSGDLSWNDTTITETPALVRIRQIIYPDSIADSTPYTRVGTATDTESTVIWSTWNTLGGNMIRKVLTTDILEDDGYAVPNTMYESTGDYTIQLPDPNNYSPGTRIGLEQYQGTGAVIYGTDDDRFEQTTSPDIDTDGNNIGAIVYIFEIVTSADDDTVYEWSLDTLQNYDGVFAALQGQQSTHTLNDQANLYKVLVGNLIAGEGATTYTVPCNGYITYEYSPYLTSPITSATLTVTRNDEVVETKMHTNVSTKSLIAVYQGDIITYTCDPLNDGFDISLVFSPDAHAMYLRKDHINDSWHDDASLADLYADGYFTDSAHIGEMSETPASVAAVVNLHDYTESLKPKMIDLFGNISAVETLSDFRKCVPAFRHNSTGNITVTLPGAEYQLTTDTEFVLNTTYYTYDTENEIYVEDTTVVVGDSIPVDTYYVFTYTSNMVLPAGTKCTVEKRMTGDLTIQYTNISKVTYTMTISDNTVAPMEWDGTDWIVTVVG